MHFDNNLCCVVGSVVIMPVFRGRSDMQRELWSPTISESLQHMSLTGFFLGRACACARGYAKILHTVRYVNSCVAGHSSLPGGVLRFRAFSMYTLYMRAAQVGAGSVGVVPHWQ